MMIWSFTDQLWSHLDLRTSHQIAYAFSAKRIMLYLGSPQRQRRQN